VKDNLYTAAWTIIQNCCEASVAADLVGDNLTVLIANFAASHAAKRIGVPERELHLIRQLMAEEKRAERRCCDANAERRLRRDAANENRPHGPTPDVDRPAEQRPKAPAHRRDR